jgi:hypothetical protein
MNLYVDLTAKFNRGRLRAILSSGQAVVIHRVAMMSKDGDWVLREEPAALDHVISVLELHGAGYRFGAPLHVKWMEGGWSSHFEFRTPMLRVRTDFVTRPPRLDEEDLAALWKEQEGASLPVVDVRRLIELKKTNREKDYAIIGELARLLSGARDQLLASRSARDIARLAAAHPDLARDLESVRPLIRLAGGDPEDLERELDAERRALIRRNERRLAAYEEAAADWRAAWPVVRREIEGLPLRQAHEVIVRHAEERLPCRLRPEDA